MAPTAAIPVIDLHRTGESEVAIAQELVEAAAHHGFVYIRHTGGDFAPKQISDAFDLVRSP
jgi:isopenicillin N synthase-like dioxygenase